MCPTMVGAVNEEGAVGLEELELDQNDGEGDGDDEPEADGVKVQLTPEEALMLELKLVPIEVLLMEMELALKLGGEVPVTSGVIDDEEVTGTIELELDRSVGDSEPEVVDVKVELNLKETPDMKLELVPIEGLYTELDTVLKPELALPLYIGLVLRLDIRDGEVLDVTPVGEVPTNEGDVAYLETVELRLEDGDLEARLVLIDGIFTEVELDAGPELAFVLVPMLRLREGEEVDVVAMDEVPTEEDDVGYLETVEPILEGDGVEATLVPRL